MLVIFNLRALGFFAIGIAVWVAVTTLSGGMLAGVVTGSLVTAALDLAVRWRAGRALFDIRAGGMICLLPVWIVALIGLLAALLIATSLPAGWDRPRPPPTTSP